MSYSEFYMQTTGSNLNAGSTASDAAAYTSAAGNWDGISVFTPTDGQTTSSLVSVGDWASVYPTGNSITPYVAQVTAVAAGANGAITLSTSAKFGTAPASGTGTRACKAGGAWAGLGLAATGGCLNTGTVLQSTRINIKAGTYANTTTAVTLALAGTTTAPLVWRGYKTTIGDQEGNAAAVAGTDIPSITFTTGQLNISGAHQTFQNLDITSASVTTNKGTIYGTSTQTRLEQLRVTNTANNAQSAACIPGAGMVSVRCTFTAQGSAQVINAGNSTYTFYGCAFVGGTYGIQVITSGALKIKGCTFRGQANDSITTVTGAQDIYDNSFFNTAGHGINITGTLASPSLIAANYFEGTPSGKYAINNTSGAATNLVTLAGNRYFPGSGGGTVNGNGDTPLLSDNVTLAGAGFANGAGGDLSPSSYLQGVGFPNTFEGVAAYRSYADGGAVQHQGAGGLMINPGMNGGFQ